VNKEIYNCTGSQSPENYRTQEREEDKHTGRILLTEGVRSSQLWIRKQHNLVKTSK